MDRKTLGTTITLIGAVVVALMSMPKSRPEEPRAHACDAQADWDQKVASERDNRVSPATVIKAITENDEPLHSILLNHIAAIYQTPGLSPAGVRRESFDACMKGETDLSLTNVK
jgi:hypothetical protein